jgi:5-methylcytosine-specific restriction endonuclease McrA
MKYKRISHRKWRGQKITMLLARDGDICKLCNQALNRYTMDPREAITFDHIVPLSREQSTDCWSNIRLVHYRCNQTKGNQLDEELGLLEA